jgi:hypothetical protein
VRRVTGSLRGPDAFLLICGDCSPDLRLLQLEPSGLFYSYEVRGEGRVRFIPFNQIRFR